MSDDVRDGDEPSEDEVDPTPDDVETPADADDDVEDADPAEDAAPAEDDASDEDPDDADADGSDDDSDSDASDDAAAATKRKSGPPPRPSKAQKERASRPSPRPKERPKQARGGGRRARRRRMRRPGSLVLSIVALLGVIGLTAWLGARAADGEEATFWIYAAAAAAALAAISIVTWFLDAWNLRHRGIGALVFIVVLSIVSLTAVATTETSPQLGLDLQGGFSVVLSAQGDPPSDNIDQAMEIIRNRIDALGVAEPEVTRQGDNVVVDLPGIEDRERAQEILGETARLEFRPVLMQGLPYDAAAAEADDDPCAAALSALNDAAAGDPTDTVPDESVPDDTTATDPADTTATDPAATDPATEAPDSTEAPAPTDEQEGAGPTPAPASTAVVDGEHAAAPLRQQDTGTTTPPDASSTTAPADDATTTTTTTPEQAADPAALADQTIVLPYRPVADEEPVACTQLGPVGFEGGSLSKAQAELGGQTGSEWVVAVRVKSGDRAQANELINACAGGAATCPALGGAAGAMAIVLDGEVISAPAVNGPNLADDEFVISGGGQGGFPQGEAKDLALKLRYGALPVEFTRSAERQISPTLGEDSLQAGILAGVIGLLAVALYLLVYYRALGVVVVLGLGVWSALMYGVVCWLSASRGLTLSLSGVVGIVISLGTTVDSYVVYFERLKDEVRLGKSVRSATERSFKMAFRTILTADVASLMGAVLLWWLTVGAVRGFAFFLGLSVVLDVFVAYCFARPMVALLARNRFFTENNVFGVARGLGRQTDDARPNAKARKAGAAS